MRTIILVFALAAGLLGTSAAKAAEPSRYQFKIPKIMMPKASWPTVMGIGITDGTVKVPACYSKVALKNIEFFSKKYISLLGTVWVHRTPEGYICESKMTTYRLGHPFRHDAFPANVKFETFAKNGVAKIAYEIDPGIPFSFNLNMHPVAPKIMKATYSKDYSFPSQYTKPPTGKHSHLSDSLSSSDRTAIASEVQPCWGVDAGLPGASNFSVLLQVSTDQTGTVREAEVAPADQGKLSNPSFARFAQRAVNAVKSYQCAKLPLPSYMLGSVHTFIFRFTP